MNEQLRKAFEDALRNAVLLDDAKQAENLFGVATGILLALLLCGDIKPETHAAESTLIDLARAQRLDLKGTEK